MSEAQNSTEQERQASELRRDWEVPGDVTAVSHSCLFACIKLRAIEVAQ